MPFGEDDIWPENGWPLRASDRDYIQPGTAGSSMRARALAITRIEERAIRRRAMRLRPEPDEAAAAVALIAQSRANRDLTLAPEADKVINLVERLFRRGPPLDFNLLARLAAKAVLQLDRLGWPESALDEAAGRATHPVEVELRRSWNELPPDQRSRTQLINSAFAVAATLTDGLVQPTPVDRPVAALTARREHLEPDQLATILRRSEPLIQEAQKALDENRFDPETSMSLSAWVRTFRMHANETAVPNPRLLEFAGASIAAILEPDPEVINDAASKMVAAGLVDEEQAAEIAGDVETAIGASAELGGDDEGVSVAAANRMAAAVSDFDERTEGIVVDGQPLAGMDTARKVAVVFVKAGVTVALTSLVAALISWASGAINFFH